MGPQQTRCAEEPRSLRTHPGVSLVYFHSSRNPERQIAAGQESMQVKPALTHYTLTICLGGSAFISDGNGSLIDIQNPVKSLRHADILNL